MPSNFVEIPSVPNTLPGQVTPDNPGNPPQRGWMGIATHPEYIKLPSSERGAVKKSFFEKEIAPHIPKDDLENARTQFSNYTKRLEIRDDEPGFLSSLVSGTAKSLSRSAGVVLGTLNSPLAFVWGAANAENVDPETFNKMSWGEQVLTRVGGGFMSAYKSATKEGDWGTIYGDYYKATRGKSIEEDLPEGLKWTAPTIEFMAGLISDPLVGLGAARQMVKGAMTPGMKAAGGNMKLPARVVAELEKFDQLQAAEKSQLQQRLMQILKDRNDYHKWWEATVAENPAMLKMPPEVGPPLMKPGERAIPDLTAARGSMVGRPIADDLATKVERPPNKFGLLPEPPSAGQPKQQQVSALDFVNKVRAKNGLPPLKTAQATAADDAAKSTVPEAKAAAETPKDAAWTTKKGKDGKEFISLSGKGSVSEDGMGGYYAFDNKGKIIGDSEIVEPFKTIDEAKAAVAGKGAATTKMHSFVGAGAGFEEDEEGNIRFDIKKGIIGAALGVGALKVASIGGGKAKAFQQTLANNPSWAKVNGMVAKGGGLPKFGAIMSKFGKEAWTKLGERLSVLSREGFDETYKQARMYNAYKDRAMIKLESLKDAFAGVKSDEVIITDYITAHRAMNRAQNGLKNPNGVTLKDSQAAIAEIEKNFVAQGKDPQVLKDALDGFQKWTHDHILKEGLDAGVISQSAYNNIVKNNKWYAAFDVVDYLPENLKNIPGNVSGEYFSVANQKIIRTAKGTEKQIADPLEATLRKFVNAQATYARNKVASALVEDPQAQLLFRPVAKSQQEFAVMTNKGLNPVMEGTKIKGFDSISRFKNGYVEKYLVPNEIAEAMKQLTPFQAGKLVQATSAIFRNAATTLYLPFTISNALRDGLMAYTTTPVYKALGPHKFFADWARGFWEGAKQEFGPGSKMFKEYVEAGGGFGYTGNLRKPSAAKAMLFKKGIVKTSADIITSPLKLIQKISGTIELAPRIGVFRRAKMTGLTAEDAAMVARSSTIDFNRGGTWTKAVNQFVPFLNARVQGRVTVADALRKRPAETAAKIFVSAVIPGMGAYAWNRLYHSDLYDDIPESIRQNYFVVVTGVGEDSNGKQAPQYLVIPKGDLGQMAFNPIEYAMDAMWKKDRISTSRFLVNTLNDISPVAFARDGEVSGSMAVGSVLPPFVKAPLENLVNLNFYTGREVVPHYMGKTLPPELQYKKSTPELYKLIGKEFKKFNVSPLKVQNLAAGLLAGYGREGFSPEAMWRGLTGRLVKTRGGEIEQRAWASIKDIENGYITARAYAQKAVEEGDRSTAVKLMRQWNEGLTKQVNEYNSEFGDTKFKEQGGITGSYMFSSRKMKNILRGKPENDEPIQKILRRK